MEILFYSVQTAALLSYTVLDCVTIKELTLILVKFYSVQFCNVFTVLSTSFECLIDNHVFLYFKSVMILFPGIGPERQGPGSILENSSLTRFIKSVLNPLFYLKVFLVPRMFRAEDSLVLLGILLISLCI